MTQVTVLTPSQFKKVNELRIRVENFARDFGYDDFEFTVEDHQYFVSVIISFKVSGWSGRHAHLFVGKRGGVTYPVWLSKTRMITRPFKDLLTVDSDQSRLCYSRYI